MIRNFLSRFMYGRYGTDQLNTFLLVLFWILWLMNLFIRSYAGSVILSTLTYVCIFYSLFRMMSRNYDRRRRENEAYLKVAGPVIHWFHRKRSQAQDRDHVYFKCPSCSTTLRVPRGKGKITITCRNCGTVFQKKT